MHWGACSLLLKSAGVQVWDLEQGRCVHTLAGHSRPVQRLHIAGGRLYSVGGRSVRVWDLATFACLRVIQQPRENGALHALAVGPDDTLYVAGQVLTGIKPISFVACLYPSPLMLSHVRMVHSASPMATSTLLARENIVCNIVFGIPLFWPGQGVMEKCRWQHAYVDVMYHV